MSGLRWVVLAAAMAILLALPVAPVAAQKKKQQQQHEQHPESEVVPGEEDPEGIPLDWLLISYTIAAAIGAAGGAIYVDIAGPLRRTPRHISDQS